MNSKKTIVSFIIFVAVIIAGVFVFQSYKENKIENMSGLLKKITIEDKKIEDNTKPFKINVVYPQIPDAEEFNQIARDLVNKEIDNFKNNSLENDSSVAETDPENYASYPREYELNISYEKGDDLDNNIISIVFNIYSFEGGAHGASYFIPLNYNLKTKSKIALGDIFKNQPNYVQKISEFCIKDLTSQITSKLGNTEGTWIEQGAGLEEENFAVFLINKKNIVFYFPQYQVAFGAAGDFRVSMPR
ncbi:MAG: DUF4163 domain-containing protein [Candidatus Staskawiczbacteria bacterium]|jgi:hypothetical protein